MSLGGTITKPNKAIIKTWEDFFQEAHERVLDTFEQHHVDASCFLQKHSNFITRERMGDIKEDDFCCLEKFLRTPALVTDTELQKFVFMEPAGQGCVIPQDAQAIYLRSFSMQAMVFEKIIAEMERLRTEDNTMQTWKSMLQEVVPLDVITIRYVGATKLPCSPWIRHSDDVRYALSGAARGSLLAKFTLAAINVSPKVIDEVKIWVFPKSFVRTPVSELEVKLNRDFKERIAIAWFHVPTLLNQRVRGVFATVKHTEADENMFRCLGTSVFSTFASHRKPLPDETILRLDKLFKSIQNKANSKWSGPGGPDVPFSDAFRRQIQLAATPFTINGHVIVLCTGDNTPARDRQGNVNFLNSLSPAAAEIKQMFQSIKNMEPNSDNEAVSLLGSYDPIICWSNISYWKYGHMNSDATSFYRDYIDLLSPLIIITYGEGATNVCEFNHSSQGESCFLLSTGNPRICSFKNRSQAKSGYNDDDEDIDDAFILIPLPHPGFSNYLKDTYSVYRFSLLATFLVIVHLDTALKIVSQGTGARSRRHICNEILSTSSRRLEGIGFYDVFIEAKQRLPPARTKGKGLSVPLLVPRLGDIYLNPDEINGSEVLTRKPGYVCVFWRRFDGSEIITTLRVPHRVIPATDFDSKRWIFFSPYGIDIKDASGQTFFYHSGYQAKKHGTLLGNNDRATLDIQRWKLMKIKEEQNQIIRLWEEGTGMNFEKQLIKFYPTLNDMPKKASKESRSTVPVVTQGMNSTAGQYDIVKKKRPKDWRKAQYTEACANGKSLLGSKCLLWHVKDPSVVQDLGMAGFC